MSIDSLRKRAGWMQTDNAVASLLRNIFKPSTGGRDWFLLWLIPILGLIFLWVLLPIVASFVLSFTDWRVGGLETLTQMDWVGLKNYKRAFTDPIYQGAIKNTLFFAAVGVPLKNLLALLLAQLLSLVKKFKGIFRTLAFLPVITPPIATIILFQFLYQHEVGLINQLLLSLGLSRISWLFDPTWVKPAIIFMIIWNFIGNPTIIFLAGLGSIPKVFREAARIDGANPWHVFWRITWPLMRRPVAYVFVTDAISWLQLFAYPQILTEGGPMNSSRTAVMQIWEVGLLHQYRGGAASSLAFILFLIILVITIVQLRFFRAEWEY